MHCLPWFNSKPTQPNSNDIAETCGSQQVVAQSENRDVSAITSNSSSTLTPVVSSISNVLSALYPRRLINSAIALIDSDQPRWKCKISAIYETVDDKRIEDDVIFEFDNKEEAERYAEHWVQNRFAKNPGVQYNILVYQEGMLTENSQHRMLEDNKLPSNKIMDVPTVSEVECLTERPSNEVATDRNEDGFEMLH